MVPTVSEICPFRTWLHHAFLIMVLIEALKTIRDCKKDSRNRFNIEFMSYDKRRETGGKLIVLKNCFRSGSNHNEMENGTVTISTRDSTHPVTVHIRLIMKVNSEMVYN
jgi:hypothetical protein